MEYITQCTVDKCNSYIFAKTMCQKHYWRVRRYGDTDTVKRIDGEGRTSEELYGVYNGMQQRCNNPNHSKYSYYGGRGVTICERWSGHDGLKNFIADMSPKPEGYTIERIDNSKGYSPNNCKWATRSEQQYNRRVQSNNTSGYKGVNLYTANNKWTAAIYVNKRKVHLGYFDTKEEAIAARKAKELELNL